MITEITLKYNEGSFILGTNGIDDSKPVRFLKSYLNNRGYGPDEIVTSLFGKEGPMAAEPGHPVDGIMYHLKGDPEVIDGLMDQYIGKEEELSSVHVRHLFPGSSR